MRPQHAGDRGKAFAAYEHHWPRGARGRPRSGREHSSRSEGSFCMLLLLFYFIFLGSL